VPPPVSIRRFWAAREARSALRAARLPPRFGHWRAPHEPCALAYHCGEHKPWMVSKSGQKPLEAPLVRPTPLGALYGPPTVALRIGTYDPVRVAAKSNSTATGSSSSAITRMNHRSTSSSLARISVAR
jgi:hypothetical protein